MSDIREAVASAIYRRRIGLDLDQVSEAIQTEWLNVADAALAVARPLIEAEARERALREAAGEVEWITDAHMGMLAFHEYLRPADAILALLPAPAEEADRAPD